MISYDEMPDDNARLAEFDIDFPRLEPDTPDACPVTLAELVDYLQSESAFPGTVTPAQVKFMRTAQVEDVRYWIWTFIDSDGTKCFATVSQATDGTICTGYDEDPYGLTPCQYVLGDYHGVF